MNKKSGNKIMKVPILYPEDLKTSSVRPTNQKYPYFSENYYYYYSYYIIIVLLFIPHHHDTLCRGLSKNHP